MTYCVGIRLNAGLVFLSDSRTNAGVDQISTCRKMMIYEKSGDRFMVLMSAGNLSISQSVREILQVERLERPDAEPLTIWNAGSMFDAARVLGSAVRRVYQQDGPALKAQERMSEIQGVRRTWFSGAWMGYGFHEDGMRAAVDVARGLGVEW